MNNVEKWTLDDGRRAEKTTTGKQVNELEFERVIEISVEEERTLNLQKRITEKTRPFVYERTIETINATGEVVDKVVESIDPEVNLKLVQLNNDSYVTKNEMIETIVEAIKSSKDLPVSACQINTRGAAEEISNLKVVGYSVKDIVLTLVIVLQVAFLAYLLVTKTN